jgi:sugar diacid utilization regulator
MHAVEEFFLEKGIQYKHLSNNEKLDSSISFCRIKNNGHSDPALSSRGIFIAASSLLDLIEEHAILPEMYNWEVVLAIDSSTQNQKKLSKIIHLFKETDLYYLPYIEDADSVYVTLSHGLDNLQRRMERLIHTEYIFLVDMLIRGFSIEGIEAYAQKILGNPMIITDESFKVITHTKGRTVQDPIWERIVSNTYSPIELQQQTGVNRFWERLENSSLPLFVDSEAFEGFIRRAVAKIRIGSETKGYIALLEAERRITRLDLHILKMLAEVLSVKINEKDTIMQAVGQLREEFTSELLTGSMSNENMISNRAKSLGLTFGCWTAVLGIQAEDQERYIGEDLEDIRRILRRHCELCIFTFNGSQAFFIVSGTNLQNWEHFTAKLLNDLMREKLLLCTVSLPTDKLTKLAAQYSQVLQMSQLLDKVREPGRNCYLYSYLAPFDIINRLNFNGQNESDVSRAYRELRRIDEKDGSEYIDTLRCYFANCQNSTNTAEKLFVHRNTVNYRLAKIRELLDDDFDDYRIRLHLQLSILADNLK